MPVAQAQVVVAQSRGTSAQKPTAKQIARARAQAGGG